MSAMDMHHDRVILINSSSGTHMNKREFVSIEQTPF